MWQEVSDGGRELIQLGRREVSLRAYAASFGFRGAEADQPHRIKYRPLLR